MIYTYKGSNYQKLFEGMQKVNDSWQKCIVYRGTKDNKVYVRTKEDFNQKFTRL